jgi:hypothetical protein
VVCCTLEQVDIYSTVVAIVTLEVVSCTLKQYDVYSTVIANVTQELVSCKQHSTINVHSTVLVVVTHYSSMVYTAL